MVGLPDRIGGDGGERKAGPAPRDGLSLGVRDDVTRAARRVGVARVAHRLVATSLAVVGLGAVLGAVGTFWLNSRTLRITARTAEVTAQTIELNEQGHLTDRYTKAIDQLGDDKLDIRLGGIYALERLAIDSERDHPTVVEVLSAFVRERSKPGEAEKQAVIDQYTLDEPEVGAGEEDEPTSAGGISPATDVQGALTVLGRLPGRQDVSRGDLTRAELIGVNLAGADLSGATMIGVNLTGADLTGADFSSAR